jgi:hypothetical protein
VSGSAPLLPTQCLIVFFCVCQILICDRIDVIPLKSLVFNLTICAACARTLAICALVELLNYKREGSTMEEQAAFADLVVKCLVKPTKGLDASIQVIIQCMPSAYLY